MIENDSTLHLSESGEHYFGGGWTAEKLERLRRYLSEYAKIMVKQNFSFAYIDAFAGTGYVNKENADEEELPLFADLVEPESQSFLSGSVKVALETEPRFTKYLFLGMQLTPVGTIYSFPWWKIILKT